MPQAQSNQIAPPDYIPDVSIEDLKREPFNYRINIEDIIYCIDVLKLSHSQTADKLNCAKSNITQRLQAYGYQPGLLKQFKNNEADRYAIRRLRIAKHLTDEKLEKMSAYQLVGMDSMTLQQERLIRGESTSNISYLDVVKAQEVIESRLKSFENTYDVTPEMVQIGDNKSETG